MSESYEKYRHMFIEETEYHLTLPNDDLIELEKNPQDQTLIKNILRVLHTLKSSATSVGYNELGRLAHKTDGLVKTIKNR